MNGRETGSTFANSGKPKTMSAIKNYLKSLNGEDFLSNLRGRDRGGTSSDPALVENSEAPVITETAVQETETQAVFDQEKLDCTPETVDVQKSTNGVAQETFQADDGIGPIDQVVQPVKGMAVVAPIKARTQSVVLPVKKLEFLSNQRAIPADAEEVPRALQQVPKSMVTILADGTAGRGFFFDQDGRIVTSCDKVHSASRIKVTTHSGDVFLGTIVGLDADRDLAVIQIPTRTPQHLPIAATGVELGADIFILNSASATGEPTRATINAVRMIGGTMLIQFDQPIPSSDCGSPLLTEQGTAIGIVSEKLKQDMANTGFGVRLENLECLKALDHSTENWLKPPLEKLNT